MRLLALVALILASPAWAQALSKPVRMIVPFPAGGGTDVLARIVAEKLRVSSGSAVIVENRMMVEAGYRDVLVQSWLGFLAPARTPQETVSRLADAIVAAARSDDAAENMRKFGMRAQTSGPAAFAATLKADLDRWAPIVKASGFTAED